MTSAPQADAELEANVRKSRRICPLATTVTCYTLDEKDPRMIAQGCRRWECQTCGPRRRFGFILRIRAAEPNRFATLTCNRSKPPEEQLRIMTRALPRLATELRKEVGPLEYLRMLETCQDGYPHFHLLIRSDYIPQQRLKALWERYTGATIVDVRKAHGRSTAYIAKYISKATSETGQWSRQRVSVSKAFWRNRQTEQTHIGFDHTRTHPQDHVANHPYRTYERLRPCYYAVHMRDAGDELPDELAATPRTLLSL